jgi:hypothetical protein
MTTIMPGMTYVEVVPDGCVCKWTNKSDAEGWYLNEIKSCCVIHGEQS